MPAESSVEPQKSSRHFAKNFSIGERGSPPGRWMAERSWRQPSAMHPHFDAVNSGTCEGRRW